MPVMFDTRQDYAEGLALTIWERLPAEVRDVQFAIARSEYPTMTPEDFEPRAAEAGADIFWEEDDEAAYELCRLYAHDDPRLVTLAMFKRAFFRQFSDDESMRRHFKETLEPGRANAAACSSGTRGSLWGDSLPECLQVVSDAPARPGN